MVASNICGIKSVCCSSSSSSSYDAYVCLIVIIFIIIVINLSYGDVARVCFINILRMTCLYRVTALCLGRHGVHVPF